MNTTQRDAHPTDLPQLLRYDAGDDILAFTTTRQGGVSEGNYQAFNINEYCGDNPAHTAQNRHLLALAIDEALKQAPFDAPSCYHFDETRIVMPHQVHGTEVKRIDESYFSLTANDRKAAVEGVDALITNTPGTLIGVSTADCIPLIFIDKTHHAIGVAHAGWRGTVARIAQKTIAAMSQAYNTNAAELHAIIGPGISQGAFEVGDEVYEAFAQARFDMKVIAQRMGSNHKWHIDLWAANRLQMTEAGLSDAAIHCAQLCTWTHADRLFSARRLGIQSGRLFTAAMIAKGKTLREQLEP